MNVPLQTRRASQTPGGVRPFQDLAGFLNVPDESRDIKRTIPRRLTCFRFYRDEFKCHFMSAQYIGEDFKRSNVMASSVYERLCHPSSIRLIKYLPNDNADEISLSLSVHQLDSAPDYQAISYVWGDPAKVQLVICNGYQFKVHSSIFSALQRIRTRSPNVLVWTDAICINQLDHEERSQQVEIMGKIYRQATTVLVHIPNPEHNCSEVKALVNDIKGFIEQSGGIEHVKYLSADDPLLADKRWESAASFKLKPWFFRTWVI